MAHIDDLIEELIEDLKQKRDELRVQINLASKDARDEWEDLEERMDEFSDKAREFASDARLRETGEGVGKALARVGEELQRGYERIRDAIRDD